jgi:acyl-CoA reductase-like NAD-dependent aldehyde dehydrogenase
MSAALSSTQLAGLQKVGDVLIPGDGNLRSFSASGCAANVDVMLVHMNPEDRDGIQLLLGVLRFLPRFAVRGLFRLAGAQQKMPEPLAAVLRQINIGVKGMVMTLYYGAEEGGAVQHALGWDAQVVEPGSPQARRVEPLPLPEAAERPPAVLAFERARAGQRSLRALSVRERMRYLGALREVVLERREEIIDRIQQDTGKTRSDALISEIFGVLDNLAWLEKRGVKALAERKQHTPIALMGKTSWTWYEPLGTILVIAPWNYPFYQAVVPIACAIAAGSTVVFKPSEWTPLRGLLEDLFAAARFAPNWVQIVYGDGAVGAELVAQRPDKIFFTGSTRTGKAILAQVAPDLIPVELELGGKDAMIVFDDVDVERAAAGCAWGALTTTGQSCTSVERVYVQRGIYEAFRSVLVDRVQRIKQEIDRNGDADIGAMTADFQVKIVARHVADAKEKGASILTGDAWDGQSKLIPPIVIDGVRDDMLVAREETFGPVIPLIPFDDEAEAIRLANDSPYGLTASVWSRDLQRAKRVGHALEVGGVSINNVMATEANPALPFGGVKQSGYGRYKGEHGLHAFCNVKSVLIDKDAKKIEANWYPYTEEKYRLFTALTRSLFAARRLSLIQFALAGLRLERYSNRAARDRQKTPPS